LLSVSVFQSKASVSAFKVHSGLKVDCQSLFSVLTDVESRPGWDNMVEETKILKTISKSCRIIYIKMKPIFPTAARDMVLISFIITDWSENELSRFGFKSADPADCFLNITKSINYPDMPPIPGVVRMETKLAGQLIRPLKKIDLLNREIDGRIDIDPNWCEILQVADTDPKGWMPKSVLQFIATKAIPSSINKLVDRTFHILSLQSPDNKINNSLNETEPSDNHRMVLNPKNNIKDRLMENVPCILFGVVLGIVIAKLNR